MKLVRILKMLTKGISTMRILCCVPLSLATQHSLCHVPIMLQHFANIMQTNLFKNYIENFKGKGILLITRDSSDGYKRKTTTRNLCDRLSNTLVGKYLLEQNLLSLTFVDVLRYVYIHK